MIALRDILMALRWAYYVKGMSLVTDYEYDKLEKEFIAQGGPPLPVGSSNPEDYPPGIRALGVYLILGGESPRPAKKAKKNSVPEDLL